MTARPAARTRRPRAAAREQRPEPLQAVPEPEDAAKPGPTLLGATQPEPAHLAATTLEVPAEPESAPEPAPELPPLPLLDLSHDLGATVLAEHPGWRYLFEGRPPAGAPLPDHGNPDDGARTAFHAFCADIGPGGRWGTRALQDLTLEWHDRARLKVFGPLAAWCSLRHPADARAPQPVISQAPAAPEADRAPSGAADQHQTKDVTK